MRHSKYEGKKIESGLFSYRIDFYDAFCGMMDLKNYA